MGELFLIRESDGCCFIFTPCGHKEWQSTRLPSIALPKDFNVLKYTPKGWAFQDKGLFGKYNKIVPASASAAKLDSSGPPLGDWNFPDGSSKHILTDCAPTPDNLEAIITSYEVPFARMSVTRIGDIWRMEITLIKAPVADDLFDDVLQKLKIFLQELARRPRAVLFIRANAQDAPTVGMRQVNRYMSWAAEVGVLLYVTVRANAIVLQPKGAAGSAFLGIIKMVQRLMPAAWPDAILPTLEKGDEFLEPFVKVAQAEMRGDADEEIGLVAKKGPGFPDPASLAQGNPMKKHGSAAPARAQFSPAAAGEAALGAAKLAAAAKPRRRWCGCCKRREKEVPGGAEKPGALASEEAALAAAVDGLWDQLDEEDNTWASEEYALAASAPMVACCWGTRVAPDPPESGPGARIVTPHGALMRHVDAIPEERAFGNDTTVDDKPVGCTACSCSR